MRLKRNSKGRFLKRGSTSRRKPSKTRRARPAKVRTKTRTRTVVKYRSRRSAGAGSIFGGGGGSFLDRAKRAAPKVLRFVAGVGTGVVVSGAASPALAGVLPNPKAQGPAMIGAGLALGLAAGPVGGALPVVDRRDVEAVAVGVALNGALRSADAFASKAGAVERVRAGFVKDAPPRLGSPVTNPGQRYRLQMSVLNRV